MTILRRTGAPAPPTVEHLVCAFAHGSCRCEATGKGPCASVKVAADRIRNRVLHEISDGKRRAE